MDEERDKQRRTYQLCRVGFALMSFALILASAHSVLYLLGLFDRSIRIWMMQATWLSWLNTPIIWASLVGAYLLWGRWTDPSWQRRAGLLLVMSIVDLVLWVLTHGEALGLRSSEVGHEWFRHALGEALGWSEFALIASLASDLLAHFGVEQAPEAGKATRSLAATGAVVWMLLFFEQTDWNAGWPWQQRGIRSLEAFLLHLGSHMLWTITLIQVTALTVATTRQATRILAEMDREDHDHDPLKPPSDLHIGLVCPHHGDGRVDNEPPTRAS